MSSTEFKSLVVRANSDSSHSYVAIGETLNIPTGTGKTVRAHTVLSNVSQSASGPFNATCSILSYVQNGEQKQVNEPSVITEPNVTAIEMQIAVRNCEASGTLLVEVF